MDSLIRDIDWKAEYDGLPNTKPPAIRKTVNLFDKEYEPPADGYRGMYLFDPQYEPLDDDVHPAVQNAVQQLDDKLFGITYKILRGKLTERNYDYIIRNLNTHGQLIEHTFEFDKSGRLHLHGLWRANTIRMQFRNLVHKGTTNKIVPIYDLDGWLEYIRKDKKK